MYSVPVFESLYTDLDTVTTIPSTPDQAATHRSVMPSSSPVSTQTLPAAVPRDDHPPVLTPETPCRDESQAGSSLSSTPRPHQSPRPSSPRPPVYMPISPPHTNSRRVRFATAGADTLRVGVEAGSVLVVQGPVEFILSTHQHTRQPFLQVTPSNALLQFYVVSE